MPIDIRPPATLIRALKYHEANLIPGAVEDLAGLWNLDYRGLSQAYINEAVHRRLVTAEFSRFVVVPIAKPEPALPRTRRTPVRCRIEAKAYLIAMDLIKAWKKQLARKKVLARSRPAKPPKMRAPSPEAVQKAADFLAMMKARRAQH